MNNIMINRKSSGKKNNNSGRATENYLMELVSIEWKKKTTESLDL